MGQVSYPLMGNPSLPNRLHPIPMCPEYPVTRVPGLDAPRNFRGMYGNVRCTGRERPIIGLVMGSATLRGLLPSWKK